MFWEALENVDDKQIEGIRSTVAKSAQRYRFGVIPQVTPVLVSRVLYFFESNTRSAAIIGVITGGGIGLMPTQAMITHKDWFSGKQRTRLIKGGEGGRGSRLGHSEIGDYSYSNHCADIANARIGKFANIASFARIGPMDHPMKLALLHHFHCRSVDL